jgi:hypothetical protein
MVFSSPWHGETDISVPEHWMKLQLTSAHFFGSSSYNERLFLPATFSFIVETRFSRTEVQNASALQGKGQALSSV